MSNTFSLWSYGLWLLCATLELLIIREWWQRRSLRHLTMLPAFAGFVLFSDIACYAVKITGMFGPFGYAFGYWWSQVIESLLRSLLAIQILSHVLPAQKAKVTLWSCYAAFWVVVIFALGLPTDVTRVFIRMITVADIIGGILVAAALVIPSIHWPKGYTTAAFALFFSLVADVGLFLVRFRFGPDSTTALRVLLPLAFIVSLLLLLSAVMAGTQTGKEPQGEAL